MHSMAVGVWISKVQNIYGARGRRTKYKKTYNSSYGGVGVWTVGGLGAPHPLHPLISGPVYKHNTLYSGFRSSFSLVSNI